MINGETVSGVTTMQMDEGLDTGDMLLKTEVPLEADETGGSLHDKLAKAGASLCVETLARLREGTITPVKQGRKSHLIRFYAEKRDGQDRLGPAGREDRAADPGIESLAQRLYRLEWQSDEDLEAKVREGGRDAEPGTIVKVEKDGFFVQTGEGQLKVMALQIPGKKRMDAAAFLRGYSMETGMRLG